MKCSNPDCMMDARTMPRVKNGPVKGFVPDALKQLGISQDDAMKDDTLRGKVLEVARSLAYTDLPELACCIDCVSPTAQKCPKGIIQFVPYVARKVN